ncbi:MAG: hypothetical protein AB1656_20045 [Candidatus Omnitrophota bacterium]
MSDLSSFSIPPRDVSALEGTKPGAAASKAKPMPEGVSFQDELIQAAKRIGENAEKGTQTSPSNVKDVDQAMNWAKNAFDDTMQAHQLMQNLIQRRMDKDNDE